MKLPHPLRQNCRTVTRTRGGWHRPPPRDPRPHLPAWLLLLLPLALLLSCCAAADCYMTRLHDMVFGLMIDTAGCGAKSSPSGDAVVPIRGHARRRHSGPGGPPCCGVAEGAAPGSGVGGGGGGAGFEARPPPPSCQAEYGQRHRRPDAGSRGPGPAQVGRLAGVMAWLSWPARRRRPVVAVVARGSISLRHGVAPGGAWYANHLEG